MKKLLLVLLSLFLVTPIVAGQHTDSFQGTDGQAKPVTTIGVVPPAGNTVQTRNQREETQLRISTEETAGTEAGTSMEKRSDQAIQHMSEVAKQVQAMLEIRTTGGIGDQVREVAREQNQAQEKIQEHVLKVETKNKLLKNLFGPDYKSLTSLNQLIAENTVRIEQLQELLTKVQSYADRTQIEAAIQAIVSQNTALNTLVQEEVQTRSLFGWLARLLSR